MLETPAPSLRAWSANSAPLQAGCVAGASQTHNARSRGSSPAKTVVSPSLAAGSTGQAPYANRKADVGRRAGARPAYWRNRKDLRPPSSQVGRV